MSAVDERVARSVALEQAYVHDVYEQFSDSPRSRPWPRVQHFLDTLEPGSLVCDVGCGNGKYLNVNNNSIFTIGGDKCSRLSELAKEKDNEVMVLDNLALPFRDESLDAVLSIAVVHHFATTERRVCALRELARVLRIGGRLIISVWAMEQSHRKFESQDVLVPWHRPQHLSTPSLEMTSTTNTSEDDGYPPYHAYTQTSDSDSARSNKGKANVRKRGKTRHKGRSIDPGRNSSPSSSSLSSPNETCYSFVRRAIQKLAGGKRVGVHRPWFLDSWSTCAKEPPQKRYDPDGCDCCECENVQDLPIELRRVDDDEVPQRRQTFPSTQIINDLYTNLKSKSMTNIETADDDNNIVRSQSSVPSIPESVTNDEGSESKPPSTTNTLTKPRLVKQKQSICDEDAEEALDKPTDMKSLLPTPSENRLSVGRYTRGNVFKQRSLNEELMSTERLREKERVRQNIQKQASLNEDLIYQRHHTFDSFRDSLFSVSTSKRFQLIKTGFTNKIKNSTTNIEKVTGASLKNGFVRMFQNWKSSELMSPTIPEDDIAESKAIAPVVEEKKETPAVTTTERRHSKEDGSDSSKDSSLQSDTSVDSEDSFASVIFVPKSDPMSPTLSPGPTSPRINTSVPNSPRIKQSSCPTSPRIKQMPLSIYPLTKQLSSPKPSTNTTLLDTISPVERLEKEQKPESIINKTNRKKCVESLAEKYAVQQIPKFRPTSLNTKSGSANVIKEKSCIEPLPNDNAEKMETLKKIRELLSQKPGFGVRSSSRSNYPIVRHSSVNNGKVELIAKPLPKLLSLELFNPETDDKDSDSSAVSSPDSVDSVISVEVIDVPTKVNTKFPFPDTLTTPPKPEEKGRNPPSMTLLEAAADVANSLDEAVEKVIKSSPRAKRRELKAGEVISVMQRQYSTDSTPLLSDDSCNVDLEPSWNDECHKHLTDFADKLSEKLLKEIDQYQEEKRKRALSSSLDNIDIDDPYIHRLSEELQDLSKLSAEIQKQNKFLAKLSAGDKFYGGASSANECSKCSNKCTCRTTRQESDTNSCSFKYSKLTDKCDQTKTASGSCGGGGKGGESSTGCCATKKDNKVAVGVNNDTNGAKVTEMRDSRTEESLCSLDRCESSSKVAESTDQQETGSKLTANSRNSIKTGASVESCDSEKGSSPNSMLSSVTTSLHFGHSIESTEGFSDKGSSDSHKDNNSVSRYSDGGSTASLASCPEWKTIKNKLVPERSASEDKTEQSLASSGKRKEKSGMNPSLSDTSQESLPSDNMGGEITYHRYYHVFREGELDQLIEKYVENLHIISSYYDHASWCVIAEKVQVWTI